MERPPTHLIETLLAVLVVRREQQELSSERRRFRRPTHEALVQQEIDRAYAYARHARPTTAPSDP